MAIKGHLACAIQLTFHNEKPNEQHFGSPEAIRVEGGVHITFEQTLTERKRTTLS